MISLTALLKKHFNFPIDFDQEITGLAIDSRNIKPGYAFFAYQGTRSNGVDYIDNAIAAGASVIFMDSPELALTWLDKIPVFSVPKLKEKISDIAADFYHYPAHSLAMIGVTGTNGKTSCAHFIASSLHSLGIPCGLIGTLGNGLYGKLKPTSLTTPDPITLHATLADFVAEGVKVAVMEVSSHSLDQGRIKGIDFKVAIFTNLTQDHLDYHGNMQAYGAAKQKLFTETTLQFAVINADDDFGNGLINSLAPQSTFAYSLTKQHCSIPLVFVNKLQLSLVGIQAQVISPWGEGEIVVPLMGRFNLSNVLAVLTTLCLLEIPFKQALDSLTQLKPVPGRMQTLGGDSKPLVVVDYAHTPDALEKVLITLRQHCQGKLFCLFGCGGDRDRGKRSLMADIAEQYADRVVITDDNPRTEDPQQIVADILLGFKDPHKVQVQHNRSKAIRDVIQYASASDCVLIAGKGAETYQQIGAEKIPFSDVEKVKEVLGQVS